MVNHSLPATIALFLFAGLAMNTRGRMEISLALNAKPDIRGTKVSHFCGNFAIHWEIGEII